MSLPSGTAIGRVRLRVADLEAVAGFYESVVGLAVHEQTAERAVLGAGDAALLELHADPGAPERGQAQAGLFHTAIRVPSRDALADALARVERDWRLTGASDHRVSEALYLADPEGNGVEIYRDRPREAWPTADGRVQMDTLPLDLDALRGQGDGRERAPPATTVGHVHLEVTSLADARAFYVDALGMTVRQEWDGALFVAAGDYHHHVGLNTWHGRSAPAGDSLGLERFELVVPGGVGAVRERLEGAGVAVADRDGALVVEDDDGIGVCVRERGGPTEGRA